MPAVVGHTDTGEDEERTCDPTAPFAALAFKTVFDPNGDLTFIRVYSGSIEAGSPKSAAKAAACPPIL